MMLRDVLLTVKNNTTRNENFIYRRPYEIYTTKNYSRIIDVTRPRDWRVCRHPLKPPEHRGNITSTTEQLNNRKPMPFIMPISE